MSLATIHELKTPEISTINRGEPDTSKGVALFQYVVLGILEFFGAEWSEQQTYESAEILFSEYYWLHIAELKHLVTKIKSSDMQTLEGKPFRVFGKFNPSMLMECFRVYADESLNTRRDEYERKAQDARYNERWGSHDERLSKDKDAYRIGGLVEHEKSKLNNNGKVES